MVELEGVDGEERHRLEKILEMERNKASASILAVSEEHEQRV